MITIAEMTDAAGLPEIQALSFDAFSEHDYVNLIMQRSEIVHDQPRSGRIIREWMAGNADPARHLVQQRGPDLARRAAAIILLEYHQLREHIDQIAPASVADIGCGYAIFDLFLWKDQECRLLLIDLEATDERHFGYRENGAAYSNLTVARSFLCDNGVRPDDIDCRNPSGDNLSGAGPVDLAVSFISCGYHYPAQTYGDFFRNVVCDDGAIILDVRTQKAEATTTFLRTIGDVTHLVDAAAGSAKRILVKKSS